MNNREKVLNIITKLYGDFIDGRIVIEKDSSVVRKELQKLEPSIPIDAYVQIVSGWGNNLTIIQL